MNQFQEESPFGFETRGSMLVTAMITDSELITRFVRDGCEDSFKEIVARHLDLVYAVAVRVSGGRSGLAEDVAQQVFIDLARKALHLPSSTSLCAWLHRATRLEALAAIRSESRRTHREQLAGAEFQPDEQVTTPAWQEVAPRLDEALDSLSEPDRQLIALRFLQKRSFRNMAELMGLTEDSTRMRVTRALERLRERLTQHGISSSTTGLAAVIAENGAITAPKVLSAQIASTACAGVCASNSTLLTSLMKHISNSKALLAGLLVTLSLSPGWWYARQSRQLQEQLHKIEGELHDVETAASEFAPAPLTSATKPNDLERAELLQLRGEVAALRRIVTAMPTPAKAVTNATVGQREPGQQFLTTIAFAAIAPEGQDPDSIPKIPDQTVLATHLGRYLRMDMLRDAGTDSVTNTVESILWAAAHYQTRRFSELFPLKTEDSATAAEKDQYWRRQMDQLAVNLEAASGMEFRSIYQDPLSGDWSLLVLLDPSPSGGKEIGTHFNFHIKDDAGTWKVGGITYGNALPPRPGF